MPTLLAALVPILRAWSPAFAQRRSALRAISQSLGLLLSLGRRTISRSLWTRGLQHQDWSADYKLHARAHWSPDDLFQPILKEALPFCPGVRWRLHGLFMRSQVDDFFQSSGSIGFDFAPLFCWRSRRRDASATIIDRSSLPKLPHISIDLHNRLAWLAMSQSQTSRPRFYAACTPVSNGVTRTHFINSVSKSIRKTLAFC